MGKASCAACVVSGSSVAELKDHIEECISGVRTFLQLDDIGENVVKWLQENQLKHNILRRIQTNAEREALSVENFMKKITMTMPTRFQMLHMT